MTTNTSDLVHLCYCRKSSEREDRQTLSNPAQRRLLSAKAADEGLCVKKYFSESQSAYKAGRPDFNDMIDRLERGEANAILVYHLTRLARNSFDGGRIIYLMDQGILKEIRTPEKIYTNTADDKFIMQIHFAMAKKSSDDTSQFVKRDVISKLLAGEYPGMVPPGYLNITREGNISKAQKDNEKYLLLLQLGRPLRREELDPIDASLVRRLFEEAEKGVKGMPGLRKFAFEIGLRSRHTGKMLSKHAVINILTNPYYYGVIEYGGQIYSDEYIQAKTGDPNRKIQHEALISEEMFQRVQYAINRRGKGRYRRHNFAFGGCVVRCGECGCPVTAEYKKGHIYYHCTYTHGSCSQRKWTREEDMEKEFARVLLKLSLPQEFIEDAFKRTRKVFSQEVQSGESIRRKLQGQYNACKQRLDSLLKMKLSAKNVNSEMLSDEEYLAQKQEIKKELDTVEVQLKTHNQHDLTWVDDCEQFFDFTQMLRRSFTESSIDDKKYLMLLICQNLNLKDQELAATYREPYATLAKFSLAGREPDSPLVREKRLLQAEKSDIFDSWLGRRDSNPRMPAPEAGALPLGDSPT